MANSARVFEPWISINASSFRHKTWLTYFWRANSLRTSSNWLCNSVILGDFSVNYILTLEEIFLERKEQKDLLVLIFFYLKRNKTNLRANCWTNPSLSCKAILSSYRSSSRVRLSKFFDDGPTKIKSIVGEREIHDTESQSKAYTFSMNDYSNFFENFL